MKGMLLLQSICRHLYDDGCFNLSRLGSIMYTAAVEPYLYYTKTKANCINNERNSKYSDIHFRCSSWYNSTCQEESLTDKNKMKKAYRGRRILK